MKITRIICSHCHKECEKPTKEINRQIKQGRTKFYCSLSCSAIVQKTTTKKIKSNCLFCGKEFETTTHKKHRKCCSKNCYHKYISGCVDREKQSLLVKRLWKDGVYDKLKTGKFKLYDFTCVMCGKIFQKISNNWEHINHPFKTCSNGCYRKRLSQSSRENPNCGGETNYKKYRYKGIWMDSTWEKNLAEWMDSKNIIWKRSKKLHQLLWIDNDGKKRRYYPDFYLPKFDLYVDTKNPYLMKCDDEKIKSVIKENNVKLICGNIDFVKKELTNHISE